MRVGTGRKSVSNVIDKVVNSDPSPKLTGWTKFSSIIASHPSDATCNVIVTGLAIIELSPLMLTGIICDALKWIGNRGPGELGTGIVTRKELTEILRSKVEVGGRLIESSSK
jgi:hypothetical protein